MEYYQPIQQSTLKTIHEHILSFRLAAYSIFKINLVNATS